MNKLVADLRREHSVLKEQVAIIKEHGVMSEHGFTELQRLKELLLEHIRHEDRTMYPKLELAARHDVDLRTLLTRFRREMNEITHEADHFFTRYDKPTRSLEFAKDVARIFALLSNRIITEEAILYPRLATLI